MPGSPRQMANQPWLQKTAADCQKPLVLTKPLNYGARHGGEGPMELHRHQHSKNHVFFERWRLHGPLLIKAIICLLVPPIIFGWTVTFLSFYPHFKYPKKVWPVAFLAAIPVVFSIWGLLRNWRSSFDVRWPVASTILFALAFAGGMLLGDMNYLSNLHHYYFIASLKTYSNINPAEVSGVQLMDAGRVQFAEGTKLKIDMGMSFTMWDTYCVAPLGPDESNSALASFDLWAVGKNCCKSDSPTFACGEYRNVNAKSGLRQTNEDERLFYALAVQQAEAAYGISAKHPIFFHWVEDADATLQLYYDKGFRTWVFTLFCHMVLNTFAVFLCVNAFKYHSRALFEEDLDRNRRLQTSHYHKTHHKNLHPDYPSYYEPPEA